MALEAKLDIVVMYQLQIHHIQFRFATHVVKNCCLFFENLQTLASFAATRNSCPLLVVCHLLLAATAQRMKVNIENLIVLTMFIAALLQIPYLI